MASILTVLLFSSIAALAAALGVLPLMLRQRLPTTWIGWANALAAGTMLAAAYLLTEIEDAGHPLAAAGGAVLGVAFIYSSHRAAGTADLDLNQARENDDAYGYQLLLINSLHAASEGVAIGIAMVMSKSLGIFMALALALHNIPEATVSSVTLRDRGVKLHQAAALAVAVNVNQILLAVATYAVVSALPALQPWVLGFAVGALIDLVMVELLPESYREAGPTSIALVTSAAMGAVVLVKALMEILVP